MSKMNISGITSIRLTPITEDQLEAYEEVITMTVRETERLAKENRLLRELLVWSYPERSVSLLYVMELLLDSRGFFVRSYYVKPTWSMKLRWIINDQIGLEFRSLPKMQSVEQTTTEATLLQLIRNWKIHANRFLHIERVVNGSVGYEDWIED